MRQYLQYVESGGTNLGDTVIDKPALNPFEVDVRDTLTRHGLKLAAQYGSSGCWIDFAVQHPVQPGRYILAIECDGASYHSALSVRDRDRIRQEILESLGWRGRIWRIWSTDWFRTPRQETEKLISFLEDTRKTWRPEHASGESWIEEGVASVPEPTRSAKATAEVAAVDQLMFV